MISVPDSQEKIELTPVDPEDTVEVNPPMNTPATDPPTETQTEAPNEAQTVSDPPNEAQTVHDSPIEAPTEPQGPELPSLSDIQESGFDRERMIMEFAETMICNIIDQEIYQGLNEIAFDTAAENCAKQIVSSPTVGSTLSEKSAPSTKNYKTYSNQNSWSCEECDPIPIVKYRNNQRGSTHFDSKKHFGVTHVIEKPVCPKCGDGEEQKLTVTEYAQKTVPRWKKKSEFKCCNLKQTKIRVKPIKE